MTPAIEEDDNDDSSRELVSELEPSEWTIIALCGLSFTLPFVMT
jgi:hypothetical protein